MISLPTITVSRVPEHRPDLCVGCLLCARWCPHDAVVVDGRGVVVGVDPARCDGCGLCVRACPPRSQAMLWPEPPRD